MDKITKLKQNIECWINKGDTDEDIVRHLSCTAARVDLVAIIRMLVKPTSYPLPKPVKHPPCKTSRQAAVQIRQAAEILRDEGRRSFPKDHQMINVYDHDAEDMESIASSVEKGKYKEAMDQVDEMDTVVRERIPPPAWKYLRKKWHEFKY